MLRQPIATGMSRAYGRHLREPTKGLHETPSRGTGSYRGPHAPAARRIPEGYDTDVEMKRYTEALQKAQAGDPRSSGELQEAVYDLESSPRDSGEGSVATIRLRQPPSSDAALSSWPTRTRPHRFKI